jgi:hypothetical protein
MTDTPASAIIRLPRWPWVVLGLGLLWTVLLRVPLIVNAEDHIDSDLAVDGLTLLDAVHGQWRWHYPGTPHMGILPLFFSYLQALTFGANAFTLVSGGTLIWLLIVTGTFWLAWKTYGLPVAGWAVLPLVFSSTGTIWLSGRITGGHLLTLAWHTLAFVGLHACISKGGRRRAATLGLWCGLGLYLDMMFLFTLFGLLPAALVGWFFGGRWRWKLGTVAAFVVAAVVGFVPHEIGRLVDPHDAYPSQFAATFDAAAIDEHGRLLALRCLPRLIAGTELEEFDHLAIRKQSFVVDFLSSLIYGRTWSGMPPAREWLAVLCLIGFFAGILRLALEQIWAGDPWRRAIGLGTFLSALLIAVAFVVNRNIFNSDNYRYLIYLVTPWSLGFGLLMSGLTKRGLFGRATASILVVLLIWSMTAWTIGWYRDRFGYMNNDWHIVRVPQMRWSDVPATAGRQGWPIAYVVSSDVTHVFGDYWDVYRTAFLSGEAVAGIPYPTYPNRFPGWSRGLGPDEGKLAVLGVRRGWPGTPVVRKPRTAFLPPGVLDRSAAVNWRLPFETVWRNDGRDPLELDRIRVTTSSADRMGR